MVSKITILEPHFEGPTALTMAGESEAEVSSDEAVQTAGGSRRPGRRLVAAAAIALAVALATLVARRLRGVEAVEETAEVEARVTDEVPVQ